MHIEIMENYLAQCRDLSLTARMALAVLIFERYCENNQIESELVSELVTYLWKWPLINVSDQFKPWESSRPELVNFGLGDIATPELTSALEKADVEEFLFRKIVSGIIEILWGSFWGAAEDELSMKALENVIYSSKLSEYPSLTPLKFSKFKDLHGWGEKLTEEDCEYWKGSFKNA